MDKPAKFIVRVVWWMQIIQILYALPFTIGSILICVTFFHGSSNLLLFFFPCIIMAYLGWANAFSTIQVTDESVTVSVFYGRFRVHWTEVNKISQNGLFLALMGNEKRVVISLAFLGKSRGKVLDYFNLQIEKRLIEFEKNVNSFPITHQNARVWW